MAEEFKNRIDFVGKRVFCGKNNLSLVYFFSRAIISKKVKAVVKPGIIVDSTTDISQNYNSMRQFLDRLNYLNNW